MATAVSLLFYTSYTCSLSLMWVEKCVPCLQRGVTLCGRGGGDGGAGGVAGYSNMIVRCFQTIIYSRRHERAHKLSPLQLIDKYVLVDLHVHSHKGIGTIQIRSNSLKLSLSHTHTHVHTHTHTLRSRKDALINHQALRYYQFYIFLSFSEGIYAFIRDYPVLILVIIQFEES